MSDTPDWTAPAIRINPTAKLTANLSTPSQTLTVDDTSGFRVGDTADATGQSTGGQQTFTGLAITALTPTTVTFQDTIPAPFDMPGDVVVLPTVVVAPQANQATIQTQLVNSEVRPPAVTAQAGPTQFSPAAAPSVTATAPSGTPNGGLFVQGIYAEVAAFGGAGAGSVNMVTLAIAGTAVWQFHLEQTLTNGQVDRYTSPVPRFFVPAGDAVTLSGQTLAANCFGTLTIALDQG